MRVKPSPGLSVRDPATMNLLSDEGLEVPDGDILWTKLLNDKDVVLMSSDQPVEPPPVEPPAESPPVETAVISPPPADAALDQPEQKGETS
jgi:hypothetical protein